MHIHTTSTQTDGGGDEYEIVDLKSQLEIQTSTVKTLKILLGHAREENEQLQVSRCRSAGPSRKHISNSPPEVTRQEEKNKCKEGLEAAQEVSYSYKWISQIFRYSVYRKNCREKRKV
jgi:hypothetical protein